MVNVASVVDPLEMVTVALALIEPVVVAMPCVVEPKEPSKRPPMPKIFVPEI